MHGIVFFVFPPPAALLRDVVFMRSPDPCLEAQVARVFCPRPGSPSQKAHVAEVQTSLFSSEN